MSQDAFNRCSMSSKAAKAAWVTNAATASEVRPCAACSQVLDVALKILWEALESVLLFCIPS